MADIASQEECMTWIGLGTVDAGLPEVVCARFLHSTAPPLKFLYCIFGEEVTTCRPYIKSGELCPSLIF